ncbi:MAG: YfiR family protein [Candidatus Eisenbacteria bacterium]
MRRIRGNGRASRFLLLLLSSSALAAGAALALPRPSLGQEIDPVRESWVKAGFVLNFLRFTAWPPESFAGPTDPVRVVVLGDERLADHLQEIVRDERIDSGLREILVERSAAEWSSAGAGVRAIHLLYVARSIEGRIPSILHDADGFPVLTVSDAPGFADRGGMLGLVVQEGRLGFEANPGAIERARLAVSSKVLRLARRVVGAEG